MADSLMKIAVKKYAQGENPVFRIAKKYVPLIS